MKYGICILGVIPVFKNPALESEIISQLLFGETFEVFEQRGALVRIRSAHDRYEGWIDSRQCEAMDAEEFHDLSERTHPIVDDPSAVIVRDGFEFPVVRGGILPRNEHGQFAFNSKGYHVQGNFSYPLEAPFQAADVARIAVRYLNCPYFWGGRSPFGIDCSGFVQAVFRCLGIRLNRDAYQQIHQGDEVSGLHDARFGDVVFFSSAGQGVTHVGIVWQPGYMIHSAIRVRIERLDEKGIFSDIERRYTHQLIAIRRMAEIV
ncbi:hydrolase Nlp/P60 [candidate division KSB3 bacterium]|uniref:Hydrolase Nlp/P60 n=1 Tax=candidate division KSB3 bacterium TaxID=2044937 RepID=A0A2G6KB22_9BACT|nr:MAG: hydrolase Nlp/P60 [candidate division KSB3 bacterium]